MSDTDISRALKDARRMFNANGEAFAMAGGLPARLDNVVIGVIARAILAERERCAKIAENRAGLTDYDIEPEAAVAESVTAKSIATSIRQGSPK